MNMVGYVDSSKERLPVLFKATGLVKSFDGRQVIRGVDLVVRKQQLTLVNGESGSGKSTLMSLVSGLDSFDVGSVDYDGQRINEQSPTALDRWRGRNLGFVFQDPHLLDGLDAGDNIVAPYELMGLDIDYKRLAKMCRYLRIEQLLSQRTSTLSGGEKQRVAIARALVHGPRAIFADEPTASLGSDDKVAVHRIFRRISNAGVPVVMISHDSISPDYADRVITLRDGQIESDEERAA